MLKNFRLQKGLKVYNFGTGRSYSVLELIRIFERQTGIPIPYKFTRRRKGDAAISYCNPKKALKELNWKAKFNLKQAVIDIKRAIE